ncbi:hypothetical protein ACWEX2_10110 [Staphylococcus xylosus]|uniref:Uncharacterized protein n=1 Tax=Staphylococcus xylosus TaxID=1288 RepID=A0AAQ0LYG8_STAXY|nr:hypothetical protein [Staphylococcus xylosus]CFO25709.1 Uncharacterised protein [Staphylococcus aureus]MCE7785548.1 hypothetical protein [Staphylococcus xylosus]MCM3519249.1 hypothetical protein [Staphylococcus xylosus]MCQ3816940.1 hypothetical protein [Staphylococcus xylosus]MCQ3819750.1 hypothetical protein [Staphylococcus xylosus]
MSNTKNSRTSSVAESLFNKEAYFSIVVIWTLIMLRDCLGHKGISFHFDVNQFFEICLLLVPTAFISSKKIIKNVKVNTIFNKRVVTTLIIICSFFTVLGMIIIVISNHYFIHLNFIVALLPTILFNMIGLLFIISGLFNILVIIQVKYLSNENI